MAIHSRILAWKTPWTEEPGGLQCMGLRKQLIMHARMVQIWLLTHIPAYGFLRILEKCQSKPKLTYAASVKESTCQCRRHETWVQSLGPEDPLEEQMTKHSSILAWEIHGQRSLMGYSAWDCTELDTTEHAHIQKTNLRAVGYSSFTCPRTDYKYIKQCLYHLQRVNQSVQLLTCVRLFATP